MAEAENSDKTVPEVIDGQAIAIFNSKPCTTTPNLPIRTSSSFRVIGRPDGDSVAEKHGLGRYMLGNDSVPGAFTGPEFPEA